MKKIRIGCGAGYSEDRLEPAIYMMENGNLDYISFECLAERTIAIALKQKNLDPNKGYNSMLEYRMERILPIAKKNNIKIISSMGAANVEKAVEVTASIAEKLGIKGLKIAGVVGDDIFENIDKYKDYPLYESGEKVSSIENIISANVYIGIEGIVEALKNGADVVITGRVADPALFLAPLVYEFGWSVDNYDLLGKGTVVGHLLECSGQVTGGCFAIPGKHDVEDLWNIGYPIAEVYENGDAIITKADGTGGRVDIDTCTEQLLYELHDPSSYITPDCIADFSKVTFENIGKNKVLVKGATGREKTDSLKVSLGYKCGFMSVSGLSFGGPKALDRAVLAGETLKKRIDYYKKEYEELRIDYIGYNSLFPRSVDDRDNEPLEVRLRVAARTKDKETADYIASNVESLAINAVAGAGGLEKSTKEVVAILSTLIPREDVNVRVIYKEM